MKTSIPKSISGGIQPTTFLLLMLLFINFSISAQELKQSTSGDKTNSNQYHPAYSAKDYIRANQFASSRSDMDGSMRSYNEAIKRTGDSLINVISNRTGEFEVSNLPSFRATQWYPLGPSQNKAPILAQLGLVSAMWVDSSDFKTIYAGSNTGGLFATYDGGNNWKALTDNYPTTGVLAVDVDPSNKNHIFIGTGHWGFTREYGMGVMESKDGGKTWNYTGLNTSTMSNSYIVHDLKILNSGADTLLAIINTDHRTKTSIYRSINKAVTWQEVYTCPKEELFDIVISPVDRNIIYVVGSKFLRSLDAGSSWEDLTDRIILRPNHKLSRMALALTAQRPDDHLVFLESYDTTSAGGHNQRFLRSDNNGEDYYIYPFDFQPYSGYWKMELQISPSDPDYCYLGGIWFFKYKIRQDSLVYEKILNHKYHKDVRELLVFKSGNTDKVYMGNDGGVTLSDDGAVTWYDITRNGFQATQLYNIAISDKSPMVYGGPQDGNLCFYNYNTGEWTKDAHIGDAYDGVVDYNDPKFVYLVSYPPKANVKNIFLLKSSDGGNNFSYRGVPDSTEVGKNNIPIAMDPVNPKIIYVGLKNIWKSTDGAETWERISDFNPANIHKIQSIEVSPSNPNVICLTFESPAWGNTSLEKVMLTTNGGTTWNDITPRGNLSLLWASATDVLIHPKKPGTIYLTLDRQWNDRKVYVTHDGGRNWQNYSTGLPNIPVNAIRYYKGAGYDILLAATDIGVFYRFEGMDKWELFGEGLPLTIVSDIEINYERKKLVASTFGRGLWEADLCLPVSNEDIVVYDTLTWPLDANLLSNLILMPGSEVTMKGKILVGDGRVIKVMPGAHLKLEGATLTNDCVSLWQGIKLYGSSDYNSTSPQGKITMRYGSVIENSIGGIETIELLAGNIENNRKGGGIIYAKSAIFRNNLVSVNLKPTTGKNPSQFILTEFSLKKQVWPGHTMKELVKIDGNSGIEFKSCVFRNDVAYSTLSINDRGVGISSVNSSYKITKLESDSIPFGTPVNPLFYQLKDGINATTTMPGYAITTSEITFKNNLRGAYISGYSSTIINDCFYDIGVIKTPDSLKTVLIGVYLDNCHSFGLFGNIFKGPLLHGPNSKMAGVVVNNSPGNNTLIANNTFANLNYSLLAQNQNRTPDGSEGLRVLYNSFSNNEYDLCITADSTSTIKGIAKYQGVTGMQGFEPAGNAFSYSLKHDDSDIHNEGEPIFYTNAINRKSTFRHSPLYYSNTWMMNSVEINPLTDSTYRPDYLTVNDEKVKEKKAYWDQRTTEAYAKYMKLKDGGNSENLISEINNTTFEKAPILYNRLRLFDSELSEQTLETLLQNNAFHNSLLVDVLYQNPVIFRSKNTSHLIQNRDPEIPSFMMQNLKSRYNNFSKIESYEAAYHNAKAIKDLLIDREIGICYNNDAQIAGSELETLLSNNINFSRAMMLAFGYQIDNNHAAANVELNTTVAGFITSESGAASLNALLQINNLIFNEQPDSLSTQQKAILTELLNDKYTFIYATQLLKKYDNQAYTEPLIMPSEAPLLPSVEIPPLAVTAKNLSLYPQPANSVVIIDYAYESGFRSGILEIINTTGQTIHTIPVEGSYGQKIVDVSYLKAGIYLVRLSQNNKIFAKQKLLIFK